MPEGHPVSARPKVAAIHYQCGSSEVAEMATSMVLADVHSSQQEVDVDVNVEKESTKEQKKEDPDIEIL